MFRNIFTDYCRSGLAEEMLMLRQINPESSTIEERRVERHSKEEADFDFDRYFTDLELTEDDYLYPMVMAYQPWWRRNRKKNNSKDDDADGTELATDFDTKLHVTKAVAATAAAPEDDNDDNNNSNNTGSLFTDAETLLLSTIPYPLLTHSSTTNNKYECWCGLLEIVVAYVYDHLTTMSDSTVESSWTISTLTTGLSYLESPTSIEEVLHSFLRRVAIYPYWRNIEEFGLYVIQETVEMLHTHGIPGIMKCLLHTRIIFEKSECYYLNNKLYVDPYLYWIQNFTGEMGNEGLSRILIELESLLMSPPDTDNCLVTEVQNSLGIDVLMEELFHTDSETYDDENSATDDDEDIDAATHDLLATASNDNESDIENENDTGTTTSDTELEVDDAATDDDDDDNNDEEEEEDSTSTDPDREEEDKTGATPTMTNVSVVIIPTTTTTTMPSAAAASSASSSNNTNRVLLDTEAGNRGGDGNSSSSSTTTATATTSFITEMMTVVGSTQQQETDCPNKDEQQQQQQQNQQPLIQEL